MANLTLVVDADVLRRVLTEDLSNGQEIRSARIENPFVVAAG